MAGVAGYWANIYSTNNNICGAAKTKSAVPSLEYKINKINFQ